MSLKNQIRMGIAAVLLSSARSPATALAQDVTLDAVGRGGISGNNNHTSSYGSVFLSNYAIGSPKNDALADRSRNFFVFDLPAPPPGQEAVAATLRLYVPTGTGVVGGPSQVDVHDVDAPVTALEDQSALYDDLGDGPIFGSRVYSDADEGTFTEVTLNAAGLASLNAALGGPYALSMRHTQEADAQDRFVFGGSGSFSPPVEDGNSQLLITWGSLLPPPSLGDLVFEDLNGNGLQDAGEPGIPGIVVGLDVNADGTIDATTVTDANGHYLFEGLTPGVPYQVSFARPNGFLFSPQVTAYTSSDLTVYDDCPVPCPADDFPGLIGEPIDVATGDFNGDGDQDMFSINAFIPGEDLDSRPPEGPTAGLLLGDGNGGFAVPIIVSIGTTDDDPIPSFVASGDFDRDGADDIVVGYGDGSGKLFLGGTLTVFPENSSQRKFSYGTFDLSASFTTAANARDPLVGDLNNDGYPDLVVRNLHTDIRVLLNDQAGGFGAPIIITDFVDTVPGNTDRLDGIALGDLNGNGKLDLLVGTSTTTPSANGDPDLLSVSVLLGNGDGTFGPPSTTVVADYQDDPNSASLSIFLRSIGAGDFNGDGKLDAVVSTFGGATAPNQPFDPQNSLVVALGDGAGGFTDFVSTYTGPNAIGTIDENYVTVADLNNDGYPDVVSSAGRVYFSDRTGGFEYSNNLPGTQRLFQNSGAKYPTLVTDFNGDKSADLVNLTKVGILQLGVVLGSTAKDGDGPVSRILLLQPGEFNDTIDAGLMRALNFEKYVNGDPADDPDNPVPLTVGDNVAYTYTIENVLPDGYDLGAADYPLMLLDDNGTPGNDVDDLWFGVSDGLVDANGMVLASGDDGDGLLNPGETWTIAADTQSALGGRVTNTASVSVDAIEVSLDTATYEGRSSEVAAVADWKPGSNPSAINVSNKGTTPVAILGSERLDVTGIDVGSLRANDELVAGGAAVVRKRKAFQAGYDDVNGDGFLDLVVHFSTRELRSLLVVDSDGNGGTTSDTFLGDDVLYIHGVSLDGTAFLAVQQVHDPFKFVTQ